MAMGQTGTVNVTPEMLNSAISAISTYRSTVQSLYSRLEQEMGGLIPGNFSGSAANGMTTFFNNTISPAMSNEETSSMTQLLSALESMCKGILDGIPGDEGVDELLGQENSKTEEA